MHYRLGSEPGTEFCKSQGYCTLYSMVCITDWGLNLAQNSVKLKAAAYYSIECITDGGLNLAQNSVNPKSQGREFNPALSSNTNRSTAAFVDMFITTV